VVNFKHSTAVEIGDRHFNCAALLIKLMMHKILFFSCWLMQHLFLT